MNIMRTCHVVNKKGRGKLIALSLNAKNCLQKKKVGRLCFQRLTANYLQLKTKCKNTVSTNLNCRVR